MLERTWPAEGATRVPYWVYRDEDLYREEQAKIWRGDAWSYLCLEAELPTLRASSPPSSATCRWSSRVTPAASCTPGRTAVRTAARWSACSRAAAPSASAANPESQAPKQLRVETIGGLVFGSLSKSVPDLETYIGPEVLPRLKRVLKKPLKVLGAYTQLLKK